MTRWGKAGVRLEPLTPAQEAARRVRRAQEAAQLAQMLEVARVDWALGRVAPCRITWALDLGGHYGPEVDAACGVEEPAVDEWEAGTRYPTWEQLLALAALTGMLPAWFTRPSPIADDAGWAIVCDRSKRRNGCTVLEVRDGPLEATEAARVAVLGPRPWRA